MTIAFLEGFDNWASAADGNGVGWAAVTGTTYLESGRYAGQSAGNPNGSAWAISRPLPTANAQVTIGGAFLLDNTTPSGTGAILALYNGTTLQCSLQLTTSKTMTFVDAAGTSHTVSSFSFPGTKSWTYIELQVVGNTSTGSATVKQDGTTIATLTGIPTFTSAITVFNTVLIGSPALNLNTGMWDDVYCTINAGATNTGFLGPIRVCSLYPSADASSVVWTPNSGSNLYSRVNEAIEDQGSTYMTAGANSLTALFDVAAVPTGLGLIFGVQVKFNGQNTGNTASTLIKSSGTLHTGAAVSFPASWTNKVCDVVEVDPATGVQWTTAGVNAMQIGIENGAP